MKSYKANIPQYEIKDENGDIIFKCLLWEELLDDMPQIHVETTSYVYDGPIEGLLNDKLV